MFLHLYEFVIVTCALATFLHSFFFLSFVRTILLLFSLAIFEVVLCGPECRRKYDVFTNFCFGSSSCFRFHMDETTKTLSVQHNKQYYYRWNGSSSYIQDTSYKVHAYLYICYQHRVIFKRPHWIWKTFSLSDSLAFRIRKYELSWHAHATTMQWNRVEHEKTHDKHIDLKKTWCARHESKQSKENWLIKMKSITETYATCSRIEIKWWNFIQ